MANAFTQGNPSQHEIYENKYRSSRMNLLLVVLFTAINLILLVTNANSYFLFSAFIPYLIASMGMLLCGRYPEEFYTDGLEDMTFFDNSVFIVLLIISVIMILLYLLAWFMSSKNRVGWLIFSLVFFGLDTLGMLFINGISFEAILDVLFHAWVIYYLILGIHAHYKLKKLPPKEEAMPSYENSSPTAEGDKQNAESVVTETPDSFMIRTADRDAKHRVLLETRVLYYNICYRRVKHTNELVINGGVYDEIEGIVEYPHTLKARIDGHNIVAGYTGTHSFISVDGEKVAEKLRLV